MAKVMVQKGPIKMPSKPTKMDHPKKVKEAMEQNEKRQSSQMPKLKKARYG